MAEAAEAAEAATEAEAEAAEAAAEAEGLTLEPDASVESGWEDVHRRDDRDRWGNPREGLRPRARRARCLVLE